MSHELTVFIIDDDPSVRDALGLLLGIHGYRVALFACAEDFLAAWRQEWMGCLLVDIRMPGMDGLSLQAHLNERHCALPLIIITGHGNVDLARTAFKAQARDFLEKPLDEGRLLAAIDSVFFDVRKTLSASRRKDEALSLLPLLTPREREIMQLVVAGKHNRDIAALLMISPRTVEVHKAKVMSKLAVDNVADLVRISMLADAG